MTSKKSKLVRCGWVTEDAQYIAYHDEEWGHPQLDSKLLLRMLCLEGQQAGLSWITVLKKRDRYDQLFYDFEPDKVAKMNASDISKILNDIGIIRHRGKIEAIINNAKCYKDMEKSGESFSTFIWGFVQGVPIVNNWKTLQEVPTQTEASVAMSKALKKKNYKFVGPTICYAFMQACGLVNDHIVDCICYPKNCKRQL